MTCTENRAATLLTEVYAEHMRYEDARETARLVVAAWSPEHRAAYAWTSAASAAERCWGRLENALWIEGHRPGRDKTIPYAKANAFAMEQARRAAARVSR